MESSTSSAARGGGAMWYTGGMSADNIKGLVLALSSCLFIGASFIIKKKGLKKAAALRAGVGGYSYLYEPLWWVGMITMVVGEVANFAAYAFAPAILVTPLGALSIIISAILAHFMLREKLHIFGILGCILCVVGSTTIVLHAPAEREIESVTEVWDLATEPGIFCYIAFSLNMFLILPKDTLTVLYEFFFGYIAFSLNMFLILPKDTLTALYEFLFCHIAFFLNMFLILPKDTLTALHEFRCGLIPNYAMLLFSAFMCYVSVVLAIVAILVCRFVPLYGQTHVMVYTAVCSLVGSISVMSVKALGIALKLTFYGMNQLIYPQTWAFTLVVLSCIVAQMNYLNKALDTFNTAVVTPIYYTMFTSLTILASVIMFKDWDRQNPTQIVTEACGFVTILSGTFLLHKTKDMADGLSTSSSFRLPTSSSFRFSKQTDEESEGIPLRSSESFRSPP